MHNRRALKHWRHHGDMKLEHRDDTDRMVAQFLIKRSSRNVENAPNTQGPIAIRQLERSRPAADASREVVERWLLDGLM